MESSPPRVFNCVTVFLIISGPLQNYFRNEGLSLRETSQGYCCLLTQTIEEYQNLSVTLSVTRQSYPSLDNSARMWISLIILTQFYHQNDYDQSSSSVKVVIPMTEHSNIRM